MDSLVMTRLKLDRTEIVRQIEQLGVVAVIRLRDPGKLRAVVDALMAGGVKALEVTMTVPGAVDLIRGLAPTLPEGFLLGAGTVLNATIAHAVIGAGAQFVISPVFRRDLITACHEHDVPALPGCFTPTEILEAHDAGADIVKVFPATTLGPQYIKDVRAPLPQVKLMPTGGVSPENAGDWIRAGAVAVAAGSQVLDSKAIDGGRFEVITENARRIVANVAQAREGK
jgi:2-dehydro-3-deoxyphosphogluconate aldolase/(4S)-4-hydroxy-2-oxoglutarate aldolase